LEKPTDQNRMAKIKKKGTESLPFKDILKSIMKERALTIRQVGDLANVTSSVVQNWLEGKNPHDLKSVSRLSTALGVSFKSLLLGEADDNTKPRSISEIYEEQDWFDGLAKVTIKRLIPRE
jgi:transcriptional regulator with XRE-family HTH domain